MKKFLAIITLVSVLSCASCTSKDNTNSTPAPSTETTETPAAETTAAASEEEATEAETEAPAEEEGKSFKWGGFSVSYPTDMEPKNNGGYFSATLKEGSDLKRSMVLYSFVDEGIDSMTPESAMEKIYTSTFIDDIVDVELHDGHIKTKDVESEESVQVTYGDFIKQKGIYHLDDFIEKRDVAYVGYFGIMDFPDYGKCPAVIIAMSEDMDDASKAEIEKIVDTAVETAKPLE